MAGRNGSEARALPGVSLQRSQLWLIAVHQLCVCRVKAHLQDNSSMKPSIQLCPLLISAYSLADSVGARQRSCVIRLPYPGGSPLMGPLVLLNPWALSLCLSLGSNGGPQENIIWVLISLCLPVSSCPLQDFVQRVEKDQAGLVERGNLAT